MKMASTLVMLCLCGSLSAQDFLADLHARYEMDGRRLQQSGELLAARNAWYKYVSLRKLEGSRSAEIQGLSDWLVAMRPQLWPAQISVPAEEPQTKETTVKQTRRRTRTRHSAKELVKKADLLRANGQLEEALRFYRSAQQTEPREDIERKIQDLEKEMN